ncbi:hypothetical protein LOTGIDRAFT_228685 [Lottia gigantea]|uniref:Uncharacterized protein n=1 Tax=Lottia gigantea TaxID=225164 RepID=V4AKF1_LOTGI|nr:hypothetical protein LOTGIDRAFT_228685 [Lottia gigantea]ESO94031.1 hypothetical protein LOTGIDRAFT_228685 [Lottia gigantea]
MDKLSLILGILFLQILLSLNCLSTTKFPTTVNQEPPLPQTPSWIKCLRVDESKAALDSLRNLILISEHWCSNAEFILNCLEKELPQTETQNPLDFFVSLNYNTQKMRENSEQLCASKPDNRKKLECTDNVSNDDIMECSMRFKQSVDYLSFVRNMTDITEEILKDMTCDITRETSRCIAARLQSCDADVSMFLNGYYGLFTNTDCLYNTSIPVEPMRPLPSQPEPTVVIKCGIEAMSFMEGDADRPIVPTGNISQAIIVSVLQQDCKMYRQRFLCYEREFPSATAFLDIWQKSVFSLRNSIISNQQFCKTISEFTSSLDTKCYNSVDRQLQNCESFYGRKIINSRVEWDNDKSNVNIQKLACNASIERATCLKEAFSICGEYVSKAYSHLQYRMLPDECFPNGLPPGVPPLPAEEVANSRLIRQQTTSQPQSEPKEVIEGTETSQAAVDSANKPKGGNSGVTLSRSVIVLLCSAILVHQLA